MPRIIATIQVRMGSERLPGKHLRMVAGRPLISCLLERVRMAKEIDDVVVALPDTPKDDVLAGWCQENGYAFYRGSEDDVLARMLGALEQEKADIGVEVYGDGSLMDPRIVDQCVAKYTELGSYDFVANDLKHTFPSGMFVETFSMDALRDSAKRTEDPSIREHGTYFMRLHPELYKTLNYEAEGAVRRPDLHFDVDTADDLAVIDAIVSHFAPRMDFSLEEIIAFMDAHPEVAKRNENVPRRWKQHIKA